jgi:hypothetical protein
MFPAFAPAAGFCELIDPITLDRHRPIVAFFVGRVTIYRAHNASANGGCGRVVTFQRK